MHLALQRYAQPTRDVFAYFWLGVIATIAVLAGVAEHLDQTSCARYAGGEDRILGSSDDLWSYQP